jgi:hypothetical protein
MFRVLLSFANGIEFSRREKLKSCGAMSFQKFLTSIPKFTTLLTLYLQNFTILLSKVIYSWKSYIYGCMTRLAKQGRTPKIVELSGVTLHVMERELEQSGYS